MHSLSNLTPAARQVASPRDCGPLGGLLSFDNGVGRLTSGDELCVVVSLEDWKLTTLDR